jgi:hypothetical protein
MFQLYPGGQFYYVSELVKHVFYGNQCVFVIYLQPFFGEEAVHEL